MQPHIAIATPLTSLNPKQAYAMPAKLPQREQHKSCHPCSEQRCHSHPLPNPQGSLVFRCRSRTCWHFPTFQNGKEACPIRVCLEHLGHPQGPTPIITDNSTALGIANDTVKQKRFKAVDMVRFYWISDCANSTSFGGKMPSTEPLTSPSIIPPRTTKLFAPPTHHTTPNSSPLTTSNASPTTTSPPQKFPLLLPLHHLMRASVPPSGSSLLRLCPWVTHGDILPLYDVLKFPSADDPMPVDIFITFCSSPFTHRCWFCVGRQERTTAYTLMEA
ncbi:hypothetical protein IV203_015578 [Nitzschia inconspicua]|uniref:Uncharacterized protein n=1 Tax=Nitzschia inconspicua TaxID=303405 RepID=A0A9K3LC35_9STRA|nr:hypothetical protein IV203_015578 [Nitzschia inconspicua]